MNLVFLPATEPDDLTYGTIPTEIPEHPNASIFKVIYPKMVWYNRAVCDIAIQQIRAFNTAPITLVGFSKSGLGAWNIARAIPELVARTIIFDAPAARTVMAPWGADEFYANDEEWQADQPLATIAEFEAAMPATHELVLVSGASFHEEMCELSEALRAADMTHMFLSRPNQRHHWNSGWIDVALRQTRATD